jgi:hypothetical protein
VTHSFVEKLARTWIRCDMMFPLFDVKCGLTLIAMFVDPCPEIERANTCVTNYSST